MTRGGGLKKDGDRNEVSYTGGNQLRKADLYRNRGNIKVVDRRGYLEKVTCSYSSSNNNAWSTAILGLCTRFDKCTNSSHKKVLKLLFPSFTVQFMCCSPTTLQPKHRTVCIYAAVPKF